MNIIPQLRCPYSGQRLRACDEQSLVSEDGSARYPIVSGIPDLRIFDPPYVSRDLEAERVERLTEASARLDFEELVRFYETEVLAGRPRAQQERGIAHRLALRARAPARLERLLREVEFDSGRIGEQVLDLGCGSGEALVRLGPLSPGQVVGVDVSLEELILGRKLLGERGVSAGLVAGCAEALPFAGDTFSFVYSPDVIEHVRDQAAYLGETRRVLRPGGTVVLNSPNRFSLVAPEPHVGIWGLGFLPRAWMDPFCRFVGKGGYTGKRLLSLPELRRLLRSHFPDHRIVSRKSNPKARSLAGKLFRWTSPVSERAFAYVEAMHDVVAVK